MSITNFSSRSIGGGVGEVLGNKNVSGSSILRAAFDTDRTLLRIHPDGNRPGTLGCIGVHCSDSSRFRDRLRDFFRHPQSRELLLDVTIPLRRAQ